MFVSRKILQFNERKNKENKENKDNKDNKGKKQIEKEKYIVLSLEKDILHQQEKDIIHFFQSNSSLVSYLSYFQHAKRIKAVQSSLSQNLYLFTYAVPNESDIPINQLQYESIHYGHSLYFFYHVLKQICMLSSSFPWIHLSPTFFICNNKNQYKIGNIGYIANTIDIFHTLLETFQEPHPGWPFELILYYIIHTRNLQSVSNYNLQEVFSWMSHSSWVPIPSIHMISSFTGLINQHKSFIFSWILQQSHTWNYYILGTYYLHWFSISKKEINDSLHNHKNNVFVSWLKQITYPIPSKREIDFISFIQTSLPLQSYKKQETKIL